MVRLKDYFLSFRAKSFPYFNSTMVRLKERGDFAAFAPKYISIPLWYD